MTDQKASVVRFAAIAAEAAQIARTLRELVDGIRAARLGVAKDAMPANHEASSAPVTLGDLIRDGKLLWVFCDLHAGGCGHERDIAPASLQLDPGEPVPGLGRRRMRCSRCGSREIVTRPELYPGGVAGWRARGKQ